MDFIWREGGYRNIGRRRGKRERDGNKEIEYIMRIRGVYPWYLYDCALDYSFSHTLEEHFCYFDKERGEEDDIPLGKERGSFKEREKRNGHI